jgi:hypothetical protein
MIGDGPADAAGHYAGPIGRTMMRADPLRAAPLLLREPEL